MFNPNDTHYFAGHSDAWQGSNGSYTDTPFGDFLSHSSQRSYLSHMPLQPPPSHVSRTSYADSPDSGLNGDQSHTRSTTTTSEQSNRTIHNTYSRTHTSQYHPYRSGNAYHIPRWNGPIDGRSSSSTNVNQYYSSSRSPSTTTTSANSTVPISNPTRTSRSVVAYHNRVNSHLRSIQIAPQSVPTSTPSLMSVVTRPQPANSLQAKKSALENEKRKLNLLLSEKASIVAKESELRKRIAKLEDEIKTLTSTVTTASTASSLLSSHQPSTFQSNPGSVITFPPLTLKYNFPPSCDILTPETFIPQQGYRGSFKSPPAGDVSLKILLRICNLNRERSVQSDHINCKFEVIVNNQMVFAGKKKPHRGPLDITSQCVGYQNSIEIKLVQPPTGFLDEPLPKEAAVQVIYAYKLETNASINALKNDDKYQRAEIETTRLVKSKFSNESGIVDDSDVKVPLTCQVLLFVFYAYPLLLNVFFSAHQIETYAAMCWTQVHSSLILQWRFLPYHESVARRLELSNLQASNWHGWTTSGPVSISPPWPFDLSTNCFLLFAD